MTLIMTTNLATGSPTDGKFAGIMSGASNTYPKCPICAAGFGQHMKQDCPMRQMELAAAKQFNLDIMEAFETRGWLLDPRENDFNPRAWKPKR